MECDMAFEAAPARHQLPLSPKQLHRLGERAKGEGAETAHI